MKLKFTLGALRNLANWSTNASQICKKTSRRGWKTNAELVRLMYVNQISHRGSTAFIQFARLQMLQFRPLTNSQRPCTGLRIEPVSATPRWYLAVLFNIYLQLFAVMDHGAEISMSS